MEIAPVCIKCKNYIKESKCKAFNSIPGEIWSEGAEHKEKTKEQKNSIIFEPLDNGSI